MLLFLLEYKTSVNTQNVISGRDMPHIRLSFTPLWNFWKPFTYWYCSSEENSFRKFTPKTLNDDFCQYKYTCILILRGTLKWNYWVTIDEHLNFSRHIGEVCKNTSRKVGVLMRLRNMLTLSAKLKIFISFIMPQITYCHTVWHFCRASDSRKMERVQERALRAVYCDTKSSYDELLRKAKLTTLGCRRLQDIAIIMYKAKYNICPPYIKDIFKLDKPR